MRKGETEHILHSSSTFRKTQERRILLQTKTFFCIGRLELSLVIEIWDWLDGKSILNSKRNPSQLEFLGLGAYSDEAR